VPRLDIAGVVLASGGLFAIVFGFSHAETSGWLNGVTLGFLAGGLLLLAAFVGHQTKSSHPLLPLRVMADRDRAGSYVAVLFTGAGMFLVGFVVCGALRPDQIKMAIERHHFGHDRPG
jgi:hypothetical protein